MCSSNICVFANIYRYKSKTEEDILLQFGSFVVKTTTFQKQLDLLLINSVSTITTTSGDTILLLYQATVMAHAPMCAIYCGLQKLQNKNKR